MQDLPQRYQYAASDQRAAVCGAQGVGVFGDLISSASMFPAFCATKPAVALGLCVLLEQVGFEPGDPVVLDGKALPFRIIDVLNHVAPLSAAPQIFIAGFAVAPEHRLSLLRAALANPDASSGYTEWGGVRVLELMATQSLGRQPSDLRSEIQQLWCADGIGEGLSLTQPRSELAETYWGIQPERTPIPCLSLALEGFGPDEIALNAYCSALGLMEWHLVAAKAFRGDPTYSLPSSAWLGSAQLDDRSEAFDPGLNRAAGYCVSFQTPVSGCGLNDIASPTTRWHPGWMGAITAWHDPSSSETMVLVLPEIDFRNPETQEPARRALINQIREELSLS